jgi:hypothetical protein
MNTPSSSSADAVPEGLRDALLNPSHIGKMNVAIWSGSAIPLGFVPDVRQLDMLDEDYELEVRSAAQLEQAKPYIMDSFRSA